MAALTVVFLAAAMFRADSRHTGVFRTNVGPALAGVKWTFATRGPVRGSPVLAGDAVLIGSGDGRLYALDRVTGRERWRADLEGAVHSAPALGRGFVFVTSRERRITALDLETGRVRWRFETGASLPFRWGWDFWLASPTVNGDRIYFGGGDGALYALDARSGKKIWEFRTGGRIRSTAAIDGGVVYVGSMDGSLYAIDARTGQSRWRFDTEGRTIDSAAAGYDRTSITSSPALSDSAVFFGARDGHMYAVDRRSGKQLWRVGYKVTWVPGSPEVSWVVASPAVSDGRVLVGSSDAYSFTALGASDGREAWSFAAPDRIFSSAAIAGDRVFFGCEDGHLFALDAKSGREAWRFRAGGPIFSSPVVDDGLVIFGSDDGRVYALATGGARNGVRTRRAVYWKDPGEKGWKWFKGDVAVRDRLTSEGYEVLDDARLLELLGDDRNAAASVVVMASDRVPAGAVSEPVEKSPFRRYLAAGGRMVWLGVPPDMIAFDSATGKPTGADPSRATRLLGVRQEEASHDHLGSRATPDGRRWGLPEWWIGSFAIAPKEVTTVLGLDEEGHASAWVKSYGGPAGSGFVRLWGREEPIPDLSWVQSAAEYAD